METTPLGSVANYSQFLATVLDRSHVTHYTITVWPVSAYTGIAEGEILFLGGFRLRIREEVDFDEQLITAYGYEAYQETKKLYWYDDFPHPNTPSLASTHPHHKHIHPNIKHNRIPAPGLSFTNSNLPQIIEEQEVLIVQYQID